MINAQVPCRVRVAQEAVAFFEAIERDCQHQSGRELTLHEREVKKCALDVLMAFMDGTIPVEYPQILPANSNSDFAASYKAFQAAIANHMHKP